VPHDVDDSLRLVAYLDESRKPLRHPGSRRVDDTQGHYVVAAALPTLERDFGVSSLVLETRSAPLRGFVALDSHDHGTRQSLVARGELRAETDLTHVTKSEPLLWIADVLAGARSDVLCGRDHTTYPLLAHRVRRVVAWSV
jgi:hypothetical protein